MAFKPPRTVFLDFPLGCPAGKPNEPDLQRDILRATLQAAPTFGEPWTIVKLPFQWSENGSREWEETVRNSTAEALERSLPTLPTIRQEAKRCWIRRKRSRFAATASHVRLR
jgi:hypothetical protein